MPLIAAVVAISGAHEKSLCLAVLWITTIAVAFTAKDQEHRKAFVVQLLFRRGCFRCGSKLCEPLLELVADHLVHIHE